MTERAKKIFFLVGFLLFIGLITYALYAVFFKPTTVPTVSPSLSPTAEPAIGTLPSAGTAGERPLLEEQIPGAGGGLLPVSPTAQGGLTATTPLTLTGVLNPVRSPDGRSMSYLDPHDGKFYTVDDEGKIRALLPNAFPNTQQITWSPKTDKAILEFPDGSNVTVNLSNGKVASLPSHWENFDFSPDGKQVVAKSIGTDPSNRWLVIAAPDGSGSQSVAALGNNAKKVRTSWSPNDQVIAFSDTGSVQSGFGRKQVLAIGKHQENLPGLVVEGFSFEPLWSPSGKQLLYSTHGPTSNYLPQVWMTNGESNTLGQNRRSLPLNTWADKCTFTNEQTAYCAVPERLPPGSGLQRELARGIPDRVYRVDTVTGASTLVAIPEHQQSMTALQVSADGNTLFFQNAVSGVLEELRLH